MAEFVARARLANMREDITSILAFNRKMFLQSIEGERGTVNLLYDSLVRDERHHSLTLLAFEEISERSWAFSPLYFVSLDAEQGSFYLRYSTQGTFNPFVMTANAAHGFLKELLWLVPPYGKLER